MQTKISFIILSLFPLFALSEEAPSNPCPTSVVQELIQNKVLNKEGLAKGGIKPPSASAFLFAGAADAVGKNIVGAMSNTAIGVASSGGSGVLSENDHLVVVLKSDQELLPLDAKGKMRVDVMDAAKTALGVQAVTFEGDRWKNYFLTGGVCTNGCQVIATGFSYSGAPKTLADGSFSITTVFSVKKDNFLLLAGNPERIEKLTLELKNRGYVAGFWQAKTQTIFSSGSACQITKEALTLIDN